MKYVITAYSYRSGGGGVCFLSGLPGIGFVYNQMACCGMYAYSV
jgi:hypothetical protein